MVPSLGFPLIFLLGFISVVGTGLSLDNDKIQALLRHMKRKEFLKIERLDDKLDSYSHSFQKAEHGVLAAAFTSALKHNNVAECLGPKRLETMGRSVFVDIDARSKEYVLKIEELQRERAILMQKLLILSVDFPDDIVKVDDSSSVLQSNNTTKGADRDVSATGESRKHIPLKDKKHSPIKADKKGPEAEQAGSTEEAESKVLKIKQEIHRLLDFNLKKQMSLEQKFFSAVSKAVVKVKSDRLTETHHCSHPLTYHCAHPLTHHCAHPLPHHCAHPPLEAERPTD